MAKLPEWISEILHNPQPFKRGRQMLKGHFYFMYLVVVFIGEAVHQRAEKSAAGNESQPVNKL